MRECNPGKKTADEKEYCSACLNVPSLHINVGRRGEYAVKVVREFQIAAVYVGTVVGAGFATGKEIVEFFYPLWFFMALSGFLIAGYIFHFHRDEKSCSFPQGSEHLLMRSSTNFFFGKKIAGIINFFFLIMLLRGDGCHDFGFRSRF
ncbi:hypothetical protein RCO48_29800 [Peribacillus frigoritolerans]|nr:hypothetical protein [Peribacillus frigoritolerans]